MGNEQWLELILVDLVADQLGVFAARRGAIAPHLDLGEDCLVLGGGALASLVVGGAACPLWAYEVILYFVLLISLIIDLIWDPQLFKSLEN